MIGAFRLNTLSAALAASGPSRISATGGTESYVTIGATTYKRHLYTTDGAASFIVSAVTGTPVIEAVIVGGGGAAGGNSTSTAATGGGGGGQYQLITNFSVSPQTYSLSIGIGGTGVSGNTGGSGASTTAFGYTSVGGGGGGGSNSGGPLAGAAGGNAGGGGGAGATGVARAGGTGTFAGGSAADDGSGNMAGGGGGSNVAVGGAGSSAGPRTRGRGANGVDIASWYGATQYVGAGGNGGGSTAPSTQPLGIGSIGSGASGTYTGSTVTGNAGATGAVIVRYPIIPITSMELVTTKTQVSSASANFVIPTGGDTSPNFYNVAAGDIAILFDNSTTTTTAIPSGWTTIDNTSTTGIRTSISYKVLTSGDLGATIVGMAGVNRKVMLVYRPNNPFNLIVPTVSGTQSTTATPTTQSLVGDVGPVITFAVYGSTGAVATRGWSVGSPSEYASFSTSGIYVKALITNSGTPSTTSITMSDGGTNTLQSFALKFI